MASCSTADVACPAGFAQEVVFTMAFFGLVWAALGWWLGRSIERSLRSGNYKERFALVTFWPLAGPLPLGNLRLFMRMRWVLLAFMTAFPIVLIAASIGDGGPVELRIIAPAFLSFFIVAVWFWVWIISKGVRRGGGLPPRTP